MPQADTAFQSEDIPAALGLLSRLPVRVNPDQAQERGARTAWAYPIAGAVIGILLGLIALAALAIGLAAPVAAGLTLVASALMTGALHEDGLADTADGFWGGAEPERRLDIMKDSRIGTYGVLALILFSLLKWSALTVLFEQDHVFFALFGTAVLSRLPMVILMQSLPNARGSGLSASQGEPGETAVFASIGIGAVLGFIGIGGNIFPAVLLTAGLIWLLARTATAKIGGQTGDVLGAAQQISEVTVLSVLASQF